MLKCSECNKKINEYVHIRALIFNPSNLCFECLVKWLDTGLKEEIFNKENSFPYISGFIYIKVKKRE